MHKHKDMNDLSIIMPVYNQEQYVADAINSILNQTYKNFEFIIVDDGSTDNTAEIINSFNDPRIRFIKASHKGYLGALERASLEAKGKWLARMDSDDVCPPDRIEKQIDFLLKHPECVFLTTSYGIVTPNNKYLSPAESSKWTYIEPSDITFGKKPFCDAATIFNREIAVKIGYDKKIELESPIWYRLLKFGKGAILEEPLYYVRWRMGSLSRGQLKNDGELLGYRVRNKYDRTNIGSVRKYASKAIDLKNEIRAVYFSATAGDFSSARKTAFEVWRRFPLKIDSLKLVLISLGIKKMKFVNGPGQLKLFPISNPFEIVDRRFDNNINNLHSNQFSSKLTFLLCLFSTALIVEFLLN